ncbi:Uu.00g042870.m01.CDS01 [Anthostomella pinea]|uniref:Uu.00g042870.m01.CDS01 n=1 Tax=Anthostomella pinea TaxID=933095 RepID=A0AAI8YBS0_9PEZI|nr:Uu.00g042870.m01.CDS01 [Anthostomella pinea]
MEHLHPTRLGGSSSKAKQGDRPRDGVPGWLVYDLTFPSDFVRPVWDALRQPEPTDDRHDEEDNKTQLDQQVGRDDKFSSAYRGRRIEQNEPENIPNSENMEYFRLKGTAHGPTSIGL